MQTILYGWRMFQKLPVNGFRWVQKASKIDKEFIKNYEKDINKGYIIDYQKQILNLQRGLPFLPEKKIKNAISLFVIQMTKKTMSCT